MPNNICARPSLDKEKGIYLDRDGWKWERETEGKQSATCLQIAAEHVRSAKEQESSSCIHIKQKQIKPSKSAKTAGLNKFGVRHRLWTFVFLRCLTPFSSFPRKHQGLVHTFF
ncbi:hypothetical protein [Neobacillus drentensis]|uniref:hypothetical protein n=1 Tax=Neobacillus drentensis TaxID=220684 RepID=UPI0030005297